MNIFNLKPKIFFGENALDGLTTFESKKFFVVADPFMVKSGMIKMVTERLKGEIEIFDGIVPDPPIETVAKGMEQLISFNPDTVIAVGGGSAIDAAKAIVFFSKKIGKAQKVRFIAIPTTSGTGSEVTGFSVITNKEKGIKYPLISDDMIPDAAILDKNLVKSVPQTIVADTGMDVLTHAIEAYVSTRATAFSDAFAEKAIRLVFENLYRSYCGEEMAREKIHLASTLAGIAFNEASLGLNHAIAHSLGGKTRLPHGRANAILLPHIIEFNAETAGEKYAELARLLGLEGGGRKMLVKKLIGEIVSLRQKLKIPSKTDKLKEMEAVAEGALADACLRTNPAAVTKENIIGILNKIEV